MKSNYVFLQTIYFLIALFVFHTTLSYGEPYEFTPKCAPIETNKRFDCLPERNVSSKLCVARGCCWNSGINSQVDRPVTAPSCFYPLNYPNYKIQTIKSTTNGYTATLTRTEDTPPGSPFKDIHQLKLSVIFETETRLRIRLLDSSADRWEVPINLSPPSKLETHQHSFDVSFTEEPFGIRVLRSTDKLTLFDTTGLHQAPLRYADQFLELSAKVGVNKGYGLGETRGTLMHDLNQWTTQALWTRDSAPQPYTNLYGVHNLFVGLADNGTAYGIFFLNSNAQEVAYQPLPAMTYRTIGGVLDFFIFLGPDLHSVIHQYQDLIGHPMLPPFWSLGFHLCRWGVKNLTDLRKINERNQLAKIPFDVQWSDIDYMSSFLDWTYDKVNYEGFPEFVEKIHKDNMKYVLIVDPGISNQHVGHYLPYDKGIELGIFINDSSNSRPLVGKVWPGPTVFPDFSNPKADEYWTLLAKTFHQEVAFDGLWIDMNEPSNFDDGSSNGCTKNNLDNPPYVPGILDNNLFSKTVCPSAHHYNTTHYNIHSMYGYFEAKSTNYALKQIHQNKRPFILSRSTFAGSGSYTFHWTGDNKATWGDMRSSITQILNFNMFGIPMIGADICGFRWNTTEELCIRWMQMGAFYPYMRNHAEIYSRDQDPAAWSPSALLIMRRALEIRYSLLPYLYTLFLRSHLHGSTVARPLSFEFPEEGTTHAIDSQFMLGSALLISPVLAEGARNVKAYIPNAPWCDIQAGSRMTTPRKTTTVLTAPLSKINVHLRGGSIIPTLPSGQNTVELRKGAFALLVCFDDNGKADGEVLWDDGESDESSSNGIYNWVFFEASLKDGSFTNQPVIKGYPADTMPMNRVDLMGVPNKPSKVTVNGHPASYLYYPSLQLMRIENFKTNLTSHFIINWM